MPPGAPCSSAAVPRLALPPFVRPSLARLPPTLPSGGTWQLLRPFASTPRPQRHGSQRFPPLPTKVAAVPSPLAARELDGKVAAARAQYEEVIHKYAVSGARRDGELVLRCASRPDPSSGSRGACLCPSRDHALINLAACPTLPTGTIFDKDGKVSRQQFKKSDLCSAHGLDVSASGRRASLSTCTPSVGS